MTLKYADKATTSIATWSAIYVWGEGATPA